MSESLFQISCPSCESVFAVTDPELVGQIIACPKCGGMMLVEAAKVATSAEVAQEGEIAPDAEIGEIAQNGEVEANVDNAQNKENSEDSAADVKETDAMFRPLRGGKLVAGGIVLAFVGALTLGGLRGLKKELSSGPEANVETENSEDAGNREDASSGAKDDVGGYATFAPEERTGEEASETSDATTSEKSEDAALSAADESGSDEDWDDNAESASVVADGFEEKTTIETENKETDGENAIKGNKENALNATVAVAEKESSHDEETGDLEGLGGLGDLGGGETLDVEENGEWDALENVDEVTATEEKLAGSSDSTGFNEADFERANQNDDSESAEESGEVDWSGVASTTSPTLQGALPTLRREKKEIDVDARLALPIKSIEFPTSPVAAIRILSEFSGVSIVPDLETIALTRSSTGATLDLSLRDTTAGEALEKVAELLNWEICKEKDRILIRSNARDSATLVEERFDVADLTTARAEKKDETRLEIFETPNNLTTEALAALIKSLVAPETWVENGGEANLTFDETSLAINQNAQNREKTRILLEGLRAIRGLEPQGDAAPERIIPEKLGWEKLTKKTTFMPLAPVSLQNAIEILEKAHKFQVFWDDAALIEAGVGRDSTTAARIANGTLDDVLSEILEPLNAAYIILGENLIFITSKDGADDYRTLEFFSLVGENGDRPSLAEARALVEEIKATIAPKSWEKRDASIDENVSFEEDAEIAKETEGSEKETNTSETTVGENASTNAWSELGEETMFGEKIAAIWLDVESSCLIVRQSQPNQRALRRWLTARLTNSSDEKKEKAD